MMRVLLDTNVVLDFMLDRQPFADEATAIWEANVRGDFEGYVLAITPVNVYYIARKIKGDEFARQCVAGILNECRICSLDSSTLQDALELPIKDFEDAVQIASAVISQLDGVVTRDVKDYKDATIPVYSPAEFLSKLTSQ